MVINTNMSALSGARLLSESSASLQKSLSRLSSGSKLNNPEDDAAGTAVSLRFDSQISRIGAAKRIVGNAVSFSQTQDGFLKKVAKALDRMSELTILAQDVTKSDADRALYNSEFTKLGQFIDDTAAKEFNDVALFDGSSLDIIVNEDGGTYTMTPIDLGAGVYTTATSATVDSNANASSAMTAVLDAITQLAEDRSSVGANISRLNMEEGQLAILRDNVTAANSRIKDVDVAEESARFAQNNILVQAGTAMLAQANALPNTALRLLQ